MYFKPLHVWCNTFAHWQLVISAGTGLHTSFKISGTYYSHGSGRSMMVLHICGWVEGESLSTHQHNLTLTMSWTFVLVLRYLTDQGSSYKVQGEMWCSRTCGYKDIGVLGTRLFYREDGDSRFLRNVGTYNKTTRHILEDRNLRGIIKQLIGRNLPSAKEECQPLNHEVSDVKNAWNCT
jgi:hypothetical protein